MDNSEEFLNSKGWFAWYNNDYYVNRKMPELLNIKQDHTYLGMSRDDALMFENNEALRDKYIKSMKLGQSALSALSKLRELNRLNQNQD